MTVAKLIHAYTMFKLQDLQLSLLGGSKAFFDSLLAQYSFPYISKLHTTFNFTYRVL